jgi:uncharacterized protein
MSPDILIAIAYGFIVGISLGLTGGGGSIFAIPLLIYGLHLDMVQAVPVSLITVAMTAAIGSYFSWRAGLLLWQPISMFASGGIIGAPIGLYFSQYFSQQILLSGFAVLAVFVGVMMWRKSITKPSESSVIRAIPTKDDKGPICKLSPDEKLSFTTPCAIILMISGLLTGVLSGLFGVGGGFLIVPILMMVINLGIHRAVGASLMIIALIGLSGSISNIIKMEFDLFIIVPFIIGSFSGMLFGRRIASFIAGPVLQRVFASAILLTGVTMILSTMMR